MSSALLDTSQVEQGLTRFVPSSMSVPLITSYRGNRYEVEVRYFDSL